MNNGENKRKHLEFIQNIITRMNTNSFMIKGWAVTLLAAIFALSAKDANTKYIIISIIVIPSFWLLDGFFIGTERTYRKLYNKVRLQDEKDVDYDLLPPSGNYWLCSWIEGVFSQTLIPFYGCLIVCVIVINYLMGH